MMSKDASIFEQEGIHQNTTKETLLKMLKMKKLYQEDAVETNKEKVKVTDGDDSKRA